MKEIKWIANHEKHIELWYDIYATIYVKRVITLANTVSWLEPNGGRVKEKQEYENARLEYLSRLFRVRIINELGIRNEVS